MKISLAIIIALASTAWARVGRPGAPLAEEDMPKKAKKDILLARTQKTAAVLTRSGDITYDMVKGAIERKGKFFTGPYNMNLVGIRGPSRDPDAWDDVFCMLYQDESGANQIRIFDHFTTDPGKYYLEHPINPKGCAIVAPGQYRRVWTFGKHRGLYDALVQRGYISVYRDRNLDDHIDMDPSTIERSKNFGINLHHGYGSDIVNMTSAGCQVLQSPSDLDSVLDLCRQQRSHGYGSWFTYTVIDESELGAPTPVTTTTALPSPSAYSRGIVEIMTDSYPSETTFQVATDSGIIFHSEGPFQSPRHAYTFIYALGGLANYQFILKDSYGDGFDGIVTISGLYDDNTVGGVLLRYDGSSMASFTNRKTFTFSTAI
jgi:hypothetical protein